jgi:hypothetical protein
VFLIERLTNRWNAEGGIALGRTGSRRHSDQYIFPHACALEAMRTYGHIHRAAKW